MDQLHEAGVHVQLRLWPFAPIWPGTWPTSSGRRRMQGVETVLANPLKIYHLGGREGINNALGRDYLATTSLRYINAGLFSVASFEDQTREMEALADLCRSMGMDMLSCDDWPGSRGWRDCCGVGGLPGFRPSPWAYYVRGHMITDHTDFPHGRYLPGREITYSSSAMIRERQHIR